jgi:nicotinamidase-related amidase
MEFARHPKILNKETTALLVIDIQEKIMPAMLNSERILENAVKLIRGFKVMNLPVYYTEQYPKGLGPTASVLKEELTGDAVQKMTFSCSGAGDLFKELTQKRLTQIIVCGVESHVCVQQSAMDLTANGFQVYLAADAASSRRELDYNTAMDRMRMNGIQVTTTESILFELLNVCGTDEFKAISKIIK